MKQYDVVIVGSGLMGLSLAGVLGRYGLKIALVERFDPKKMVEQEFDGRTTALSLGTRRVLEAAGLWSLLEKDACPIDEIRVADGHSPLFLHFDHREVGNEAFGWIVENRLMRYRFVQYILKQKNIDFLAPDTATSLDGDILTLEKKGKVKASLFIGADGKDSSLREWCGIETKGWGYGQSALVCCVKHELDHEFIAVEHFLPDGPFAILPMYDEKGGQKRSGLVWTVHNNDTGEDQASYYMNLSKEDFNKELQAHFGDQLGHVEIEGDLFSYPLTLQHAKSYIGPRVALTGEAAHRMHPIAGQGLNLGMRDVALLAELIVEGHRLGLDIGSDRLLMNYERRRKVDNKTMMVATDGLNKLFSNNITPIRWARQIGLGLVERTPFAKRFFMRQAMGLSGIKSPKAPKLLKGESL